MWNGDFHIPLLKITALSRVVKSFNMEFVTADQYISLFLRLEKMLWYRDVDKIIDTIPFEQLNLILKAEKQLRKETVVSIKKRMGKLSLTF